MPTYCALTVRKLKPGSYDDWRRAWWPKPGTDEMPEGSEVYIVRNVNQADEVIAFGLFEGDLDELSSSRDTEDEQKRQEAMAPFIDSIGADGLYEVIEHIGARSGARA